MAFADKTLTCRDCGQPFTFTVSEQQFFADRGFENEPSRCHECRAAHKANRDRGGMGAPSRNREMVDVTCSSCGKETQVPFRPTAGRPVYCSDCFQKQRTDAPSRSYR